VKPYVRMRRCPKCAFYPATTVYRVGPCNTTTYSLGCHHPAAAAWWSAYHDLPQGRFGISELDYDDERLVALRALRDAVGEHFERECPNCKYQWAEAVVGDPE
jgi:hypothetical protein